MSAKRKLIIVFGVAFLFAAAFMRDMFLTPDVQHLNDEQVADASKAEMAPDVSFVDAAGKKVKLSDLKGKVVVMNFWASWCKPCLEELPALERMMEKAGSGVVLLMVSNDQSIEAMQKFILNYTAKGSHLFISDYSVAVWDKGRTVTQDVFHTLKYPETVIIDKNGRMVKKIIGKYQWDSEESLEFIKELKG